MPAIVLPRAVAHPGRLGKIALLAMLYVLTGRLGLELAHLQQNATIVWPPTGLALAALILFGRGLWPGVLIGALIVNLSLGTAPVAAAGIAIGNTLEAVVGAWLLERFAGFDPKLRRMRDVVAFLAIGVFGCTLISATVGVATLWTGGAVASDAFWSVWLVWWLGDAGGAMVIAPVLLVGMSGLEDSRTLAQNTETWVVFTAVAATTWAGWGGILTSHVAVLCLFLPFPFMVWAGARLGPRGAVTSALIAVTVAVIGTATSHQPLAMPDMNGQMLFLWAYAFTLASVSLLLAAAVSEREAAEQSRASEEKRRMAQELARLEWDHRMQESQRLESLGVLAGGVAHDVNNILVPIRGNADLLGMDTNLGPKALMRLGEIKQASVRAAELCQRLLAYAGQARPTAQTVWLAALFSELRPLLGASVSKKVQLSVHVPAELPPVWGDPGLLRQVFLNILLNAGEAVGEGTGSVRVEAHEDHGMLVIAITDDGPGMDIATQRRIFDPFFTTRFAGRGLGLAAVRGIVSSHNGTITVASALGKGSRFEVRLPVSDQPHRPSPPSPDALESGPGRRVVLVVDDEEQIRELIAAALGTDRYTVWTAEDGQAAVEIVEARGEAISAVLMDITMPRMSGPEALLRMKQLRPSLPVGLMSGYARSRGANAGADAFLSKPFTLAQLGDWVTALLEQPAH